MSWVDGIRKGTTMGGLLGGPWSFTQLPEPLLSSELARLSRAGRVDDTDIVTFQPCPNPEENSQDRYVVQDLELPDGSWKLRAVFDGHGGHEAVDFVVETLPGRIFNRLRSAEALTPGSVAEALVAAISSIDDTITADFLALFPGDGSPEEIAKLSDDQIRSIINDGGPNLLKVHRLMRGTTVLIALSDPHQKNLWIANLGDCQAVLGVKATTGEWQASLQSSSHNGVEPSEVERIRREHSGEAESILNDRVLGAIAVTRALGDQSFKLPSIYTNRVFLNARPGFRVHSSVQDFSRRNLTPPYLSSIADVRHVQLNDALQYRLILCSDGFVDQYHTRLTKKAPSSSDIHILAGHWIRTLANAPQEGNVALYLLRDSLGSQNEESVSAHITLESSERWMDDTTVLVQHIR